MRDSDLGLFYDDECVYHLIKGDLGVFEKEYTKLQKEYQEKNLDYSDFYEVLDDRLKSQNVEIIHDMPIIYHDYLNFN